VAACTFPSLQFLQGLNVVFQLQQLLDARLPLIAASTRRTAAVGTVTVAVADVAAAVGQLQLLKQMQVLCLGPSLVFAFGPRLAAYATLSFGRHYACATNRPSKFKLLI